MAFEVERYLDPAANGHKSKDLVREGDANELPLTLSWEGKTLNVSGLALCEASTSALTLKAGEKGTLKFTCVSPEGLTLVKTFTFKGDSYGFDLAVQVTNRTGQPVDGQLNLDLSENFAGEEANRFHFLGFNGSINNKLEDIKSGGLKDPKTYTGKVEWAGLDEGYFITAIIPESAKSWITLSEPPKASMVASVRTPVEALGAGQAAQFSYVLYFGPKNLDDLKPFGLDRAVNFGWFDFLGKPLLKFLNWLEPLLFQLRLGHCHPDHPAPDRLLVSQPQELQVHEGHAEAPAQGGQAPGEIQRRQRNHEQGAHGPVPHLQGQSHGRVPAHGAAAAGVHRLV